MSGPHAGSMTASLYATTSPVYAVARAAGSAGPAALAGVTHAVSHPVVDGLTASECGLLVDAAAGHDWRDVAGAQKCAECARVAG